MGSEPLKISCDSSESGGEKMRLVLRLASLCFRSPKTPSPLWDSLEATGIRPAFRFIAMYDGLAEPLNLILSLRSSYTLANDEEDKSQ